MRGRRRTLAREHRCATSTRKTDGPVEGESAIPLVGPGACLVLLGMAFDKAVAGGVREGYDFGCVMDNRLGTAAWSDPALAEKKYRYGPGSIWLGRSQREDGIALGYADDRHVCLVSGTRAGKGTTSIINNLCLWPGSLVAIDPKGENATITAARRGKGAPGCEGLGQAVHVLDPFRTTQVDESYRSRFNPLDALDPEDEEIVDEAGMIADALVTTHSTDPFWDESARSMIKTIILHVMTAPEYEGRRNLVTVRDLIVAGDGEAAAALEELGKTGDLSSYSLLWTAVRLNHALDGVIARIGVLFDDMYEHSKKTFDSVLQTASRNTDFLDSAPMKRCVETSDFSLSELKTNPRGVSLYLSLPTRHMAEHFRWLRMMIALTVNEMERVKGMPANGERVLMCLDEFAGLERMKKMETAVAEIAGEKVKLFFVLQSLEQLKAVYKDKWETFLGLSGLKVFFNLDDQFSREYVSKLIGDSEMSRDVHSTGESKSISDSVSEGQSRTRSDSVGESSSRGHSQSEGRSDSLSTSSSTGMSGRIAFFGPHYETESENKGISHTSGTSRGETESWSEGNSRTATEGSSRTSGTSRGSTVGKSAQTSQTLHRRPLINPDEIGRMFARLDRQDALYPGLGLVLISGSQPIVVRRVNYYEDPDFIGLFQPHPDHPFTPAREDVIDSSALAAYSSYLPEARWEPTIAPGTLVRSGEAIGFVYAKNVTGAVVKVRAPRSGRFVQARPNLFERLPGSQDAMKNFFADALYRPFSTDASLMFRGIGQEMQTSPGIPKPRYAVLFYETGAPRIDPFGLVASYCESQDLMRKMQAETEERKRQEEERKRKDDENRRAEEKRRQEFVRCRNLVLEKLARAEKQWMWLIGATILVALLCIVVAVVFKSWLWAVAGVIAATPLAVFVVKLRQVWKERMDPLRLSLAVFREYGVFEPASKTPLLPGFGKPPWML